MAEQCDADASSWNKKNKKRQISDSSSSSDSDSDSDSSEGNSSEGNSSEGNVEVDVSESTNESAKLCTFDLTKSVDNPAWKPLGEQPMTKAYVVRKENAKEKSIMTFNRDKTRNF